ncbi:hypothetical protein [Streptomyces sp. CAU 1734]|uniref:hypothetical protein n=1 Tax=Streptomyces sp. CAU 1734 TaxID=3140360 RepID=UPI00326128E4
MNPTPTIGRTVLYRLSATDADYISSRARDAAGATPELGDLAEGTTCAAAVTYVHPEGDRINLHVLLDGQLTHWVTSRRQGQGPGTWSPPPCVPDLADTARLGYEAYGEERGWLTWDGRPMPPWGGLSPETRAAWQAGAAAILRHGQGG